MHPVLGSLVRVVSRPLLIDFSLNAASTLKRVKGRILNPMLGRKNLQNAAKGIVTNLCVVIAFGLRLKRDLGIIISLLETKDQKVPNFLRNHK